MAFDCFLKCCCRQVAAGRENEKSRFGCWRVPEWLVFLLLLSVGFGVVFVGMSVYNGYEGKHDHNIYFLVYGIILLLAPIKIIVVLCMVSKKAAYIAMAIAVAELGFGIGGVALASMRLDGFINPETPAPESATQSPPNTPWHASTGTKALLAFVCIFLLCSIVEIVLEIVLLCRFAKYVKVMEDQVAMAKMGQTVDVETDRVGHPPASPVPTAGLDAHHAVAAGKPPKQPPPQSGPPPYAPAPTPQQQPPPPYQGPPMQQPPTCPPPSAPTYQQPPAQTPSPAPYHDYGRPPPQQHYQPPPSSGPCNCGQGGYRHSPSSCCQHHDGGYPASPACHDCGHGPSGQYPGGYHSPAAGGGFHGGCAHGGGHVHH